MSEGEPHGTQRLAGILIPVFSIRGKNDLGIGDVASLREMVDYCADIGFGFLQLLPINETGPDNSPYNAISSVAFEPLTLDCSPEGLGDLSQEDFDSICASHDVATLRTGSIRYFAVRKLKEDLLRKSYEGFLEQHYEKGTDRDRAFQEFCEKEAGWLNDYCIFRTLMVRQGGNPNWQEWDENLRTRNGALAFITGLSQENPEAIDREVSYFGYVQWIAFRQWREAAHYAREKGVSLMGDIPFGISVSSADVFANRDIFDLDWYGGAPPEKLFKDDEFVQKWGQNWGIPLYKWDVLESRNFDWWRQRIGKCVEICNIFRVDHALGFYRIYSFPWNPVRNGEFLPLSEDEAAERCDGRRPGFRPRPDDNWDNQQANRAEGEKYFRMMQEAAGDAEIVAEDLGMVPDYVGPSLESLSIAGMKVPQWEFSHGAVTPGVHYPAISFATYATHDHAPIKAQWEAARAKLESAEWESPEWWDGRNFLHAMCQFAGIHVMDEKYPEYSAEVQEQLLRQLGLSNSYLIGIMINDLMGTEERINVPGIMADANWSYRLDQTMDELAHSEEWTWVKDMAGRLLDETGRRRQG